MTTPRAKDRARSTEPTELTEPDLSGLTPAQVERYMVKERERHVAARAKADRHKLNYLVAADHLVRVLGARPIQPLAQAMGVTQQTLSEALRTRWDRLGVSFSADRRPGVPSAKARELEAAGWVQYKNQADELVWYLPGKPEHEAEGFQGWDLTQAFRAMKYRGQTAEAVKARTEKVEATA